MTVRLQIAPGKMYSHLTIIKELPKKNGRRCFLALCRCGKHIEPELHNLTGGRTTSCGCMRAITNIKSEKQRKASLTVEIGTVQGFLTVQSEYYENGERHFKCSCACGNNKSIRAATFINDGQLSCGCYGKIRMREEQQRRRLEKSYIGEPCINGHDGRRYIKNNVCVYCNNERAVRMKRR